MSETAALGEVLDLLARKITEDEPTLGTRFPYVTNPDGSWRTLSSSLSAGYTGDAWSHGNWFCGFWVGLLVAAHLRTGDAKLLEMARDRMALVAQRVSDGNTHDIGFIFYSSALPLYRATGETVYADLALEAADQLRRRTVLTQSGSYISSWGPLDDVRGRASSAIDTMANIPLLYWAAEYAGDASFAVAGEEHARMTQKAFVRPDFSTYHAVEYDLVSGARKRGYTFQGFADESLWSRGQGWAIYGYADTARVTGKVEYIHLAEKLAERYFERVDAGLVPFWDFDDPEIPAAPRDSAAAAIIASGLLHLAQLHPDAAAGARWRDKALAMLDTLCRDYLAREPAHRGLLRHGCYSKPHNDGADSAVLFGDFYFVEAVASEVLPGLMRPVPERLKG